MGAYEVKWGIMATGGIATAFALDLLVDPESRNVSDIKHVITAVASSTSKERAQGFLEKVKAPSGAYAYGSYEELVADSNVDVVYVATPHSHHFANTLLAIHAGKHVLVEKPITVNAVQARILFVEAKKQNVFIMEAVWTRFFPLSIAVRDLVKSGAIGEVKRVVADLSLRNSEDHFRNDHRMVNPELAGGALLDLGIYSLTWIFQVLYHILPVSDRKAPDVAGSLVAYPQTGVDESTVLICTFPANRPGKSPNVGVAMTSIRVSTSTTGHPPKSFTPAARIQGSRGEIQVSHPLYRPESFAIISESGGSDIKEYKVPGGQGFFYEADAVARCLRDGTIECETMGWEESCIIMETMDKLRKIAGLSYPGSIESTSF